MKITLQSQDFKETLTFRIFEGKCPVVKQECISYGMNIIVVILTILVRENRNTFL